MLKTDKAEISHDSGSDEERIFFTFLSKPDRFNIAARLSTYIWEAHGSEFSRITNYAE
jgi:hypothetical protein